MTIKKYEITQKTEGFTVIDSWDWRATRTIWTARFMAEIEGTETMKDLVLKVSKKIPRESWDEGPRYVPAFCTGYLLRTSSSAVDEEAGLAGFVLEGTHTSDLGKAVHYDKVMRGVYAIKKERDKLLGRLVMGFDSRESYSSRESGGVKPKIITLENNILGIEIIVRRPLDDFSYYCPRNKFNGANYHCYHPGACDYGVLPDGYKKINELEAEQLSKKQFNFNNF